MVPMIAIFILRCRRRSNQKRNRARMPRRSVRGINTCRSCGMTMFCSVTRGMNVTPYFLVHRSVNISIIREPSQDAKFTPSSPNCTATPHSIRTRTPAQVSDYSG